MQFTWEDTMETVTPVFAALYLLSRLLLAEGINQNSYFRT